MIYPCSTPTHCSLLYFQNISHTCRISQRILRFCFYAIILRATLYCPVMPHSQVSHLHMCTVTLGHPMCIHSVTLYPVVSIDQQWAPLHCNAATQRFITFIHPHSASEQRTLYCVPSETHEIICLGPPRAAQETGRLHS